MARLSAQPESGQDRGAVGYTDAVIADLQSMAVARSRPINEGAPAGNAADCGWARHFQRRDPLPDARRAEDGMLFRVFLSPEDLRRLVGRAMEQDETAAIVGRLPAERSHHPLNARRTQRVSAGG